MEFNLRAISLAPTVNRDDRRAVAELLGKEVDFRQGITLSITLPDTPEGFQGLPETERLLTAFGDWSRVYSYHQEDHKSMHILVTADGGEAGGEIVFYRVDLEQPLRIKPGPRPAVEIVGGAIMTYDECGRWLVDLAYRLAANADRSRPSVIMRPRPLKRKPLRVGWVGPEIIKDSQVPLRLNAIGRVFGAEIIHVSPRNFVHVQKRLAEALPLDAVIICSSFASYISTEVVPGKVCRELIHFCESTTLEDIQNQIVTWIEVATDEIERSQQNQSADENDQLLRIMLKGMLSHTKIGPFNHCPKTTVLTGVRARHLNVATAERILDDNSEVFQDTKTSTALFLWKAHNDGDQYFLNPQRVEDVKAMVMMQ